MAGMRTAIADLAARPRLSSSYARVRFPGKSARTKRVMRNRALMEQQHGPRQHYRVYDVHVTLDHLRGEPVQKRVLKPGLVTRVL